MVAIHTKFIGPPNFRGSRYKAYTTKDRKTVTLNSDHRLGLEDNHRAAAIAYCQMMNWEGKLISGSTDEGYVFVFLPHDLILASKNRGPSYDVIELPERKIEQAVS